LRRWVAAYAALTLVQPDDITNPIGDLSALYLEVAARLGEAFTAYIHEQRRQSVHIWRMIRSGAAACCGGLAVIILCLSLHHDAQAIADASTVAQTSSLAGQAYVFRFDPTRGYSETFAIPTVGANLHSVEAAPNAAGLDVWFTEPGADQIGRLIYTSTTDYAFREYPVAEGSMPLNLAADADGGYIWFTAHRGNWIGRLAMASGDIVTFPVPTAGSEPAGIDIAPDGSVWFTEMAADKIGRLTPAHQFEEYPIDDADVGAYGIAVQNDKYVWFGESKTGTIKRLSVAGGTFLRAWLPDADGYPYALLIDAGRDYLWLTERDKNRISQVELGTLTIVNTFPITPMANSLPTGLTLLGGNELWFSAQGSGQIGQMVYTSPATYRFEMFNLPVHGLWAMDTAADESGHLWTVAYVPRRVFLPLTVRSH
jgi:streptogramin lyase